MTREDELKRTYRGATIVGLAMVGSVLIYAVVVEIVKLTMPSFRESSAPSQVEIFRYIFFGIALAEFFLIRLIRALLLSGRTCAGGTSGREETVSVKIQRLMSATIVTYALCESVAILGLVLFLIGRNSSDFYILFILSLLYFFLYFPRYSQWEEWVRQVEKEG